jgi:hypothetical protein
MHKWNFMFKFCMIIGNNTRYVAKTSWIFHHYFDRIEFH